MDINVICNTIKHLKNNISKNPKGKLKWNTKILK